MGISCSKPGRYKQATKQKKPRLRRLSNTASEVRRDVTRRISRIGLTIWQKNAVLDPASDLSSLFDGLWKESISPDKKVRLSAMNLPFIVQKAMENTRTCMKIAVKHGGLTISLDLGLVKTTSDLRFGLEDVSMIKILGFSFLTNTIPARGIGGSYQYVALQNVSGRLFKLNSELTPELKGDSLFLKERCVFQPEKIQARVFTLTLERAGPVTSADRQKFAEYEWNVRSETKNQVTTKQTIEMQLITNVNCH